MIEGFFILVVLKAPLYDSYRGHSVQLCGLGLPYECRVGTSWCHEAFRSLRYGDNTLVPCFCITRRWICNASLPVLCLLRHTQDYGPLQQLFDLIRGADQVRQQVRLIHCRG
jgi:hypothetical protein